MTITMTMMGNARDVSDQETQRARFGRNGARRRTSRPPPI